MLPQTVDELLKAWHEAGRATFEKRAPSLNYDTYEAKTAKPRAKYTCLDVGTSGAFMLENETGRIFSIKGYGRIDRRKFVGVLGEVSGERMNECRYMRPNLAQPMN